MTFAHILAQTSLGWVISKLSISWDEITLYRCLSGQLSRFFIFRFVPGFWSYQKEQVKGWSRIRPHLRISLLQVCITSQLWPPVWGYDKSICCQGYHQVAGASNRWYPWQRIGLSSAHTAGHSWEVMYSWNREILKGGWILDQPLTCSLLLKCNLMLAMSPLWD